MHAQVCSKCNGQKIVNVPPWVAGDCPMWSSTGTPTYTCNVCGGTGLVIVPDTSEEMYPPKFGAQREALNERY